MQIPQIKFRKMTLEENINLIKWAYFEDNGQLDVRNYTIMYFPELGLLDDNLSKGEIYKKIEEIVTKDYKEYEKKIETEVKRYDSIWAKYNNEYMNGISNYLNIKWPDRMEVIDVNVGLIPVFPRYLDTFSFSVSTNVSAEKIIEVCAHESLHFIWFEKWKQLYPNCPRREYDSPYIPWQYSEMVVDPILNSKEINDILHIKERAYDSFYELEDNGIMVMDKLMNIYNSNSPIEEKIIEGYDYIDDMLSLKGKLGSK